MPTALVHRLLNHYHWSKSPSLPSLLLGGSGSASVCGQVSCLSKRSNHTHNNPTQAHKHKMRHSAHLLLLLLVAVLLLLLDLQPTAWAARPPAIAHHLQLPKLAQHAGMRQLMMEPFRVARRCAVRSYHTRAYTRSLRRVCLHCSTKDNYRVHGTVGTTMASYTS